MTRRLLRTITVTTIITESWTLVWREKASEPSTIQRFSRSVRNRSTVVAAVVHLAHEPLEDAAGRSGRGDASQPARPNSGS